MTTMLARCLVATLVAAITFVLVAVLLGAAIGQMFSGIPAGQTVIPIIGELAIPVAAAIYVFKRSLMGFMSEWGLSPFYNPLGPATGSFKNAVALVSLTVPATAKAGDYTMIIVDTNTGISYQLNYTVTN